MPDVRPFQPTPAATKNIAATNSSQNVNVIVGGAAPGPQQLRIHNAGTATVFVKKGDDNTVTASATADMPVPAGAIEVITVTVPQSSSGGVWMAAITASGTATVYFTPGVGL